jgi:hypothetical protein
MLFILVLLPQCVRTPALPAFDSPRPECGVMVIQINTTAHFLDSSGKETKVLAKAVSLHEDFDSIEIDPMPETAKPAPATL